MGVRSTPGRVHPPTRTIAIRLAIGVVGGGSEARYKGVGNLQREWGGPIAIRRGQTGVAFATSAQARGLCVVTTILPFVIYSAIPIGAVVIWLVARSVMRSEIRASNQLVERRREEWRAGGCVGPEPGKYRGPERSDWRGWFAGGGPGMGGGGGGGCGGGGN